MSGSRCCFFDSESEAELMRHAKGLNGLVAYIDLIDNQYIVSW